MADAELCIICVRQPREIRLQCGHLFACANCVQHISICAICRHPIYATSVVRESASSGALGEGSQNRRGDRGKGTHDDSMAVSGYISSGSESYTRMSYKPCFGCQKKATLLFECTCQGSGSSESFRGRMVLCASCAQAWVCPFRFRNSTASDFRELSSDSLPSSTNSQPAPRAVCQ